MSDLLLKSEFDPMGHAECFRTIHGKKWLFVDGLGWLQETETKSHYEQGGAVSSLHLAITEMLTKRAAAYKIHHNQLIAKAIEQKDTDKQRELNAILKAILTACKRTKSKVKDIMFNLEPLLRTEADTLDKVTGMDVLNVKNGYVDLKTGKLHNRTADSVFTYVINVEYNEDSTKLKSYIDEWHEYIANNTLNGEADANWLQVAMGYTFCGGFEDSNGNRSHKGEECFIYLQGTRDGRNGKSMFLETIMAIFGNRLTAERDISTFKPNQNNPGGPRADLVQLRQSRLVNIPEIAQGISLSHTTLKQITGKSLTEMEARNLQQSTFIKFLIIFVIWMDSNFEPSIDASDGALKNRLRVVEWPYHYSPNPNPNRPNDRRIIIDFKQRFTHGEYRAAVFKWVVDGAVEWYKSGLGYPVGHEERAAELMKERDTLAQYMESHNLIACPQYTNFFQVPSFYSDYSEWVKDELNMKPLSPIGFSQRLKGYGVKPSDKKARVSGIGHAVRFYRGIVKVDDINEPLTEITETYNLDFNKVESIPFDTVRGAVAYRDNT